MRAAVLRRRVRILLGIVVVGLVLSGLTAFGVFGLIPLWLARRAILELATLTPKGTAP